jgi:hypothetical protein
MYLKIIRPFYVVLFYLFIFNNFYANGENSYLRFRNSILRIYIANDKNRLQLVNEYSNKLVEKIKNKLVKKYYDLNIIYNNLTDEERELVDFIISLCF